MLKLGKLPARPGAVKFALCNYMNTSTLPEPPADFGFETLVPQWGMLANDQVGDCYIAGAMHEEKLWCAESQTPVQFSDTTAISYYSELTGYNPADPSTDQGTDVAAALKLRRTIGVPDDTGKRHKIGAYVALKPGSVKELFYAAYYFDGVGIGLKFPQQWMTAFENGTYVWDSVTAPDYQGGHYVSAVAWRNGNPVIVSWGRLVELTTAGYEQNCDEVYAYLSPDKLENGVDRHGFNLTKLRNNVTGLTLL